MTTASAQIAAENQRRRIPDRWLVDFNDMTDAELADLADTAEIHNKVSEKESTRDKQPTSSSQLRAFAGWELEYREAFGISVGIDKAGKLTRSKR